MPQPSATVPFPSRSARLAAAVRCSCRLGVPAALLALTAASPGRGQGASAGFEGALLRPTLLGFGGARTATTVGGGAFVAWEATRGLGLRPEILLLRKGWDFASAGGTADFRVTYLEFPLLATYALPGPRRLRPGIFLGPALALTLGSEQTTSGENPPSRACCGFPETLSRQWSLMGGGGVSLALTPRAVGLVELRYDYGLSRGWRGFPVLPGSDGQLYPDARTGAAMLMLGLGLLEAPRSARTLLEAPRSARTLRAGERLRVTTSDTTQEGWFVVAADSSLRLVSEGVHRSIPWSTVHRIEVRERHASAVGGVVGTLAGLGIGGLAGCLANPDDYGVFCAGQDDTPIIGGAVVGAMTGGILGALLFRRERWVTVAPDAVGRM